MDTIRLVQNLVFPTFSDLIRFLLALTIYPLDFGILGLGAKK
jgi:hypothetical protein